MTTETEAALREALKRAGYASMGGQADRFLQEARALLATPQPTQTDEERAADLFERMACIADDAACLKLIVAAFAQVRAEGMEWRDIATAPLEEWVLLATTGGWVAQAILRECEDGDFWEWADLGKRVHSNLTPLGWLPLPRSPERTT